MVSQSRSGHARRQAEIFVKRKGETVSLLWTEWPNGKTTADPTTGATPQDNDHQPVVRTLDFKCLVHFIAPTITSVRQHQEVQVGDAIIDFIPQLVRVTDAGDTDLAVGDLITIYALNLANRAPVVVDGGEAATATTIDLFTLEDPRFIIAGSTWVSKPVGEGLAKSWDAVLAGGVIYSRPFLLRKAT